jgi:hypothetical protein
MDIYREGDPVALGTGWYASERDANGTFRWVSNDARINVAQLVPAPTLVSFLIEPGPGVELKPFELLILDENAQRLAACKVRGKETVSFELPAAAPTVRKLTLRVENGGKLVRGDDRVLNFRIFTVSVLSRPMDIVHPQEGVTVGSGWYPLENFNGVTFRWAANEAVLHARTLTEEKKLRLEIEPGPGMGFAPFDLTVSDAANRLLATISVGKRQFIELPFNEGVSTLRLKVERDGKPAPNDPRIMNYRAFSFMD